MKIKAIHVIAIALVIMACYLLPGCKQIKYVPVEKIRTEYIHDTTRTVLCEYDSIMVQDSVAFEHYKDSVDKYYELHREIRLKFVHDTTDKYIDRFIHDSIQVPVEIPVEKNLTPKEAVCLWVGTYLWWIIVLAVIYLAFRIYKFIRARR